MDEATPQAWLSFASLIQARSPGTTGLLLQGPCNTTMQGSHYPSPFVGEGGCFRVIAPYTEMRRHY